MAFGGKDHTRSTSSTHVPTSNKKSKASSNVDVPTSSTQIPTSKKKSKVSSNVGVPTSSTQIPTSKKKSKVSSNIGVPTSSTHVPSKFVPPRPTSFPPPLYSLPHLGYTAPTSTPYYSTASSLNMHVLPSSRSVNPIMHASRPEMTSSSYPVLPSTSCPVNPSPFASSTPFASFPFMSSSSIPSYGIRQTIRHSSMPSSESTRSSAHSISRPHVRFDDASASSSTDTDRPTHPPIQISVERQFPPDVGKLDDHRRLIIAPDGASFAPSTPAVKAVVDSFCSFYRGFWKSWSDVPDDIRERMYAEFKTMCAWLPKYEAQVRRNFFKKCVDRMPDLLRTARNSGNRPFWILEDVWPKLIEYWGSEEFLKKSELGKAARASTRGGSLHTCGSISMGEHRRRLEGLKKRPVSQVEEFEETHMTKPKDGTQPRWIEPQAENTINAYNQIMEEFMLSQPKDDQGNPIQPSEEQIKDIWVRAAGGVHKGKVYGLGSECISSSYTSRFSSASYMSQSSVNHEELEQMRRTIAELNEKYMQEKAAREEEMRQKDVKTCY